MNMRIRNTPHPVFIRYIFVFLLFSLVLLVLFIPLYRTILDFTLRSELQHIHEKLNNGVSALESAVFTLNNAVISTARDSRFRIFQYKLPMENYNPYTLIELRDYLNSLIQAQSIISDCGIIFSDNNVLTRRHSFYFTELFSYYGHFFSCEDFTFDEWLYLLRSQRPFSPLWEYKSEYLGSYEAITFSATWSALNWPEESVFFATIPVKNIIPLLVDDETANGGFIRVSDIRGNILINQDRTTGGKLHILKTQSAATSLTIEIGIPDSLIFGKMKPVRNMLIVFSGFLALVTISLSLIFAYKSSASFITIDEKLETSLQTIEQQARLLKVQIFDSALQKGVYTIEDLRQFHSVFSDFPEKFQLADIRYRLPGNYTFEEILAAQIRLINMIKEFQRRNNYNKTYVQGKDGNIIVLLLPVSAGNGSWHEQLKFLRNELNTETDINLSFALSDIFEKPSDIYRAWQQLQFIHVVSGNDYTTEIEQTGDIPGENIQLPLGITTLELIYNNLNDANDEIACSILLECSALLPNSEDDLIPAIIHSRLSNMLMQMKLENHTVLFDIDIPVYIRENRREIFEKQFPECFRLICERIRNRRQNSITTFGQEIVDFINDHLYDPNLYITMIADHFNISPPTLQKLMKKISDQTFMVYIENQRLLRAHEMLMTGSYSIQEVAAQCGFAKADSFYKAFKRTYGFAPSKTINKSVIKD